MNPRTFVEKIFDAPVGSFLFKKPAIVLSHDNTIDIRKKFLKIGGTDVFDSTQLMIVLNQHATPVSVEDAKQYQLIRGFVQEQKIDKFYDLGRGICHQLLLEHGKPGMLLVGSDRNMGTAGAMNCMAVEIDPLETATLWKTGETWFRVPKSIKINLTGRFKRGVTAKDLALWIVGMLEEAEIGYQSIEFHGKALAYLSISSRMCIANTLSDIGIKNVVFPCDDVLEKYIGEQKSAVWADEGASYSQEYQIQLEEVVPLVALPKQGGIKAVSDLVGTPVQQVLAGTCCNGRLSDLAEISDRLRGRKIDSKVHMCVVPASRDVYQSAIRLGAAFDLLEAGVTLLPPSCATCKGLGQAIPADESIVLSTGNSNEEGRMGNSKAFIYLASPATVAASALRAEIRDPRPKTERKGGYPYQKEESFKKITNGNRKLLSVWDFSDVDHMNSAAFQSESPLQNFLNHLEQGDVLLAGNYFGGGNLQENLIAVMLRKGLRAVITKSVHHNFYRSALRQGLLVIENSEITDTYRRGDAVEIDLSNQQVYVARRCFTIEQLPKNIKDGIEKRGYENSILSES